MTRFWICLWLTLAPSLVLAQSEWLGQKVFIKDGVNGRVGNEDVSWELLPFPATVEDVNGNWLWLSRAWVQKKDVMNAQEALKYFTEQIRRDPTNSAGWGNRAIVWDTKGEPDNAIKDYSEAIRLDPENPTGYMNRGATSKRKGDFDNAIKDYNEAIRLDPGYTRAYYNRAKLWYSKNDYDNALKDYSEAIRLDPEYAVAYNDRGWVRKLNGDFDNALKDFNESIRLDPKNGYPYYNRGEVWEAKEEYGDALKDYTEANRLDPKDGWAYNKIAWLKATCPIEQYRNGKAAIENATKACELTEWKENAILDTLAAAYAESGDFENAKKWQQKAIDMASEKDRVELRSRLTLYEQGKPYREESKRK